MGDNETDDGFIGDLEKLVRDFIAEIEEEVETLKKLNFNHSNIRSSQYQCFL